MITAGYRTAVADTPVPAKEKPGVLVAQPGLDAGEAESLNLSKQRLSASDVNRHGSLSVSVSISVTSGAHMREPHYRIG